MDEKELLKELELPKSTQILRTFPFNKIADQFPPANRKMIRDEVKTRGIRLLASINPRTTNIPAYSDDEVSFEEIHLFEIRLDSITKAERIYRLLAEAIPYPLIIRFIAGDKVKWILADHERIQKNGMLKMKKLYQTNTFLPESIYLERWRFGMMDTYNLRSFYKQFVAEMAEVELHEQYGAKAGTENEAELLEKLKQLDKQIDRYIGKAKKATQLNKRVQWQMKANELKNEKEQLLGRKN